MSFRTRAASRARMASINSSPDVRSLRLRAMRPAVLPTRRGDFLIVGDVWPKLPQEVTGARRSYRRIDPAAVHETIVKLEARIAAHFPVSGLRRVAQDLIDVSHDTPQ